MTLNLNKHGAAMQAAWKEVLDPTSPINWALFGYEGTSFDLRLVSKGEDGIEELMDDLNSNKIMYAFCLVEDPKSSLPKFVLLHWQGEGAPGTRKGICTTHLKDISNYFRGASVTFNARNEDEVNLEEIMEKVVKASATTYNFKEKPTAALEEVPAPVGSNHRRIIPQQELPGLSEREKFWNEEQSKEKARIADERQRKVSENTKIDQERREREAQEAQRRERETTERERKISKMKEEQVEKERKERERLEASKLQDNGIDDSDRAQRSEAMRNERKAEAERLISQRSNANAKAVFERNSSAGQLNFKKQISVSKSPDSPAAPAAAVVTKKEEDELFVPPPPIFNQDESAEELPEASVEADPPPPDLTSASVAKPDIIQDIPTLDTQTPDVASSSHVDNKQNVALEELGVCALALYDYQAADDTEISFDPNQVITNIDQIDPGWWQGLAPSGNYGLFPANYVEIVAASEVEQLKNGSK